MTGVRKQSRIRGVRRESGLLVASESARLAAKQKAERTRTGMLKRRPVEKVLHLPDGRTMVVRIDDSGTAAEHEFDDHQDAIVRPDTIRYSLRPQRI